MPGVGAAVSPFVGDSGGVSAAWLPTDIAGCVLWLRADQGITLNGADVAAWADQSGAGNNAVQAAPGSQPAFSAGGGVGGQDGVDFDRANAEFLDLTGWTDPSNDYTVVCVLHPRSGAAALQHVLTWGGTMCNSSIINVANRTGGYHNAVGWQNVAAWSSSEQWLEWHWDSGGLQFEMFRNGASIGTGAYGGTQIIVNNITMGGYIGPSHSLDAMVSELIVYNQLHAAPELAGMRGYIAGRY